MNTEMPDIADPIGDELAGALGLGLAPADLGSERRARLRERIVSRVRDAAPAGTFTLRAAEPGWQALDDRVQIRVLRRDEAAGNQTVLIRLLPGGVIAAHAHLQEEECFVLSGEIEIGAHSLRAGDMHVAPPGTEHQRIRSHAGALLLVRSEIPAGRVGVA
jgi:quercetin dioxygenase-like cupin family protein